MGSINRFQDRARIFEQQQEKKQQSTEKDAKNADVYEARSEPDDAQNNPKK